MFEGQIVPAAIDAAADSPPGSRAEGGALWVPAWAELVARLAAAHDLRRAMARAGAVPAGNFSCFGECGEGALDQGERLVNPDGLVHGKGPGGMAFVAAKCAVTASRETR